MAVSEAEKSVVGGRDVWVAGDEEVGSAMIEGLKG